MIVGYEKSVSLLKLRRLAEGVDTHTLISGRLPDRSRASSSPRSILEPRDLEDPWGTRYRYIVQGEKFYLVGFDADGHTDPDLLFSRSLVLRDPKGQDATLHGTREITVVE